MGDFEMEPFTDERAESIRTLLSQMEGIDERIGGWTSKVECRQTGLSLHARFDKKTNVQTSMMVRAMFEDCPEKLASACRRLLAMREAMLEVEKNCPCGARPESLNTHPHVMGCPVGKVLRG